MVKKIVWARQNRKCKVCKFSDIELVHKKREEDWSYQRIADYMNQHFGTNLNKVNLSTHFRNHCEVEELPDTQSSRNIISSQSTPAIENRPNESDSQTPSPDEGQILVTTDGRQFSHPKLKNFWKMEKELNMLNDTEMALFWAYENQSIAGLKLFFDKKAEKQADYETAEDVLINYARNPNHFIDTFCGLDFIKEQAEVRSWIIESIVDGYRFLVIFLHREFGKTEGVANPLATYFIANPHPKIQWSGRNVRIGYLSESKDKAKEFMSPTLKHLAKPRINRDFKKFNIGRDWNPGTTEKITVRRTADHKDATLTAYGKLQQIAGVRKDVWIVDDYISQKMAESYTMQKKFHDIFFGSIIPAMEHKREGVLIMFATVKYFNDFYQSILKDECPFCRSNHKQMFRIFLKPAITKGNYLEEGKDFRYIRDVDGIVKDVEILGNFETFSRLDIKTLLTIRGVTGLVSYEKNYQLNAEAEEGNIFKMEWLKNKFFEDITFPLFDEGTIREVWVDLSGSDNIESDYAGVWAVAIIPRTGQYFFLYESHEAQIPYQTLINTIMPIADGDVVVKGGFHPHNVRVEAIGDFKTRTRNWKNVAPNLNFKFYTYQGANKHTRICSLDGFLENHAYFWKKHSHFFITFEYRPYKLGHKNNHLLDAMQMGASKTQMYWKKKQKTGETRGFY